MTCTQTSYSTENPLNREPDLKDLISNFITPIQTCYDRNHGPIPHLSSSSTSTSNTVQETSIPSQPNTETETQTHTLKISGLVPTPLTLTLHQLRTEFPRHEVTCALQCAGNRRHAMRDMLQEVQGIEWSDAAVMNCRWRGVKVKDLLERAGVMPECLDRSDLHVAFSCYQVPTQQDTWFGGSVPVSRCCEAVVAFEINSSPLPPSHGYPLRAVLPGIVGARWTKWLDEITLQDHESTNFYQKRDYKILPEEAVDSVSAEKFWDSTPAMCDSVLNSVVAVPGDQDIVSLDLGNREDEEEGGGGGWVDVKGYAVPGGQCGPVVKVEVSGDKGGEWTEAEILDEDGEEKRGKWSWVLWRARVWLRRGENREVWSRAMDKGGNVQKEHSQWNLRGVGYNGYGRARGLTVR